MGMPDEGEDVLLPKRKKPPDIWQITMIDAIIAAHNNATLAEECAAEIAANVAATAAATAAAAVAAIIMAKITDTKSETPVAFVAAANFVAVAIVDVLSSQPPTPKPVSTFYFARSSLT